MRHLNVATLSSFVTTTQEQHQQGAVLRAVDSVAGPVVDPHLEYAFADGPPIATQARLQSVDTCHDPGASRPVA
jgi:hypothetical protein